MNSMTMTSTKVKSITGTNIAVATAVAALAAGLAFMAAPAAPNTVRIAGASPTSTPTGTGTPSIITPANNSKVSTPQNGAVKYTWTAVPNAVNYRFQLDFLSPQPTSTWVSVMNYNRGNYTSNYTIMNKGAGSYRVRVQAIFSDGTVSPFSNYNLFNYIVIPPMPVVMVTGESPTNGSSIAQVIGKGIVIGRFKVYNYSTSSQVSLTSFKFADRGSHIGTSTLAKIYYSNNSDTNYLGNTLASNVAWQNGMLAVPSSSPINIDGNSYRYITVAIQEIGGSLKGDTYSLYVAQPGDIKYSLTEANFGYDLNGNGNLLDTVYNLPTTGNPQLGTYMKTN